MCRSDLTEEVQVCDRVRQNLDSCEAPHLLDHTQRKRAGVSDAASPSSSIHAVVGSLLTLLVSLFSQSSLCQTGRMSNGTGVSDVIAAESSVSHSAFSANSLRASVTSSRNVVCVVCLPVVPANTVKMSSAGKAQYGTCKRSSLIPNTDRTAASFPSEAAYSPCGSTTTMFAAGHPLRANCWRTSATVVVFPEPVEPTTALCRSTKRPASRATVNSSACCKAPNPQSVVTLRRIDSAKIFNSGKVNRII